MAAKVAILLPVDNFPRYYVDDEGGVWHWFLSGALKPLKPYLDKWGYLTVKLRKEGRTLGRFVHRLVADAFIPNPERKPQVNHKNGTKHDSRADNLEWVTGQENFHHAIKSGLVQVSFGSKNRAAKLNEIQVACIKSRLRAGETRVSLGLAFKVHPTTIRDIHTGLTWRHVA